MSNTTPTMAATPRILGAIVPLWTAWCYDCGKSDNCEEPKREYALRHFRDAGWKRTRPGWVCPSCSEARGLV